MFLDPIDRLHQENARFLQAQRFMRKPNYMPFSLFAEEEVINRVSGFGYRVTSTIHTCPFDLWVEGVRVEVKGSRWNQRQPFGGRYQANIRNHQADILIFDCINGTHHFFVVPVGDIAHLSALSVTSYNVDDYTGRLAPYLEAWELLHQAIKTANNNWQPPLF